MFEKLPSHFDIILNGTSLVNSILSAAFAKRNYSVLHVESSSFYGGSSGDGTLTVQDWCKIYEHQKQGKENNDTHNMKVLSCGFYDGKMLVKGSEVLTPFGAGIIEDYKFNEDQQQIVATIRMKHWSGILYSSEIFLTENPIINMKTRFLLDQSQKLLVRAHSDVIQHLLNSNVSEYLEFIGCSGLNAIIISDSEKCIKKLFKVPSDKSSIFKSKDISPLDKRRLMKFLGVVYDYGVANSGGVEVCAANEDHPSTTTTVEYSNEMNNECNDSRISSGANIVHTLNERQLNNSRALLRPQNKKLSEKSIDVMTTAMNNGTPFHAYLQNQKIDGMLLNTLQHVLALDCNSDNHQLSTKEAVESIYGYLSSLGVFPIKTGYLLPLYGIGEIASGFCRCAAVNGAIFLLRRKVLHFDPFNIGDQDTPEELSHVSSEDESKSDDNNKKKNNISVVISPDLEYGAEDNQKEERISCTHFITPNKEASLKPACVLRRRISILPYIHEMESYCNNLVVMPPNVNRKYPVHMMLLDATAKVCQVGYVVLHSTTIVSDVNGNSEDYYSLAEAVYILRELLCPSNTGLLLPELFHVEFTYKSAMGVTAEKANAIEGLHWTENLTTNISEFMNCIHEDNAYIKAREIFWKIIGNQDVDLFEKKQLPVVDEEIDSDDN